MINLKRHFLVMIPALGIILGLVFTALPTASVSAVAAASTPTPAPSGFTTLTGISRVYFLRVRDAASTRAKRLFFLQRGDKVTVLGISKNRRWLKILTQDGKIGWVSGFYIKLVGGHVSNLETVQ